jgi:hypothetical protein
MRLTLKVAPQVPKSTYCGAVLIRSGKCQPDRYKHEALGQPRARESNGNRLIIYSKARPSLEPGTVSTVYARAHYLQRSSHHATDCRFIGFVSRNIHKARQWENCAPRLLRRTSLSERNQNHLESRPGQGSPNHGSAFSFRLVPPAQAVPCFPFLYINIPISSLKKSL